MVYKHFTVLFLGIHFEKKIDKTVPLEFVPAAKKKMKL